MTIDADTAIVNIGGVGEVSLSGYLRRTITIEMYGCVLGWPSGQDIAKWD